ncbi:hypothetical protein [Nocardioides plantarum]|uniref:Uncharacterized protein n=1 Tax=Nocardioides plantarum TaxID=29299 RepID=A0ABV5KAV5_9ACTN|nr:hypothetical protein [Nocardioides plantarum]
MSHPSYSPPPPADQKYRPRARWFVVGVVLVVLAGVVFVGGLFLVLRPLTQEDGIVAAGDGPVTLDVPAGEERAIFTRDDEPVDCTITDSAGEARPLRGISGDFTYNEWTAQQRFDTGSGDVVLDCTSTVEGAEARIAQVPSTGGFVVGLLVAILGPLALGFAGVVVLIVTGILYAVRPARPRQPRE